MIIKKANFQAKIIVLVDGWVLKWTTKKTTVWNCWKMTNEFLESLSFSIHWRRSNQPNYSWSVYFRLQTFFFIYINGFFLSWQLSGKIIYICQLKYTASHFIYTYKMKRAEEIIEQINAMTIRSHQFDERHHTWKRYIKSSKVTISCFTLPDYLCLVCTKTKPLNRMQWSFFRAVFSIIHSKLMYCSLCFFFSALLYRDMATNSQMDGKRKQTLARKQNAPLFWD